MLWVNFYEANGLFIAPNAGEMNEDSKMENIYKSKAELLNELELLQKEHASLKLAYQNDIIEKKLAEESLIQNEARLSAFMQHIPSLIMIKDNELRPIYANNKPKK